MPFATRRHHSTKLDALRQALARFSWCAAATMAMLCAPDTRASSGAASTPDAGEAAAETSLRSEYTNALNAYAARAAGLRRQAITAGTVAYQEVLEAAYAPGMIDAARLAAKAHWRAAAGSAFTFVTDYTNLRDPATVQPLLAVADPELRSTLVAQYESTTHVIGLAPVATDFAIFHEAGHALQRHALRARGGASGRRTGESELSPAPADGAGVHATTIRRLRYLCSQDEFEVRLQDLNRFHALLVAGRPIMDTDDSVRALIALGVPLTYEETAAAFLCAGQNLSRQAFARLTASAPVEPATIAVAFEDARELGLMRRLILRSDPARWPRLLAKIIFEAPGHL